MATTVPEKSAETAHQLETVPTTTLDEKLRGNVLDEYAQDGVKNEHDMTPLEAIKTHPMAVFWCLMVSMCVVMEGYDTILIGNFYAYPAFARNYGVYVPTTKNYQITARLCLRGSIRALLNGYLVSMFGQKRVLLGALIVLTAFIFMTVFAQNLVVLLVGEIMCGLPWGIFATTAPAYASEVLPLPLRVYLTSYTNMCFIMGQLIAAGVLSAFVDKKTWQWAYRIPFAIQWAWPLVLFPVLLFSPESPWHLVRKGRLEEAEKSIRRLQRSSAGLDPKQALALIVHTNNIEQELTAGTSYLDCFRGVERRRTEISCMCFAGQVFVGSLFAYNSTYFFQQIGFDSTQTYRLNVGSTGMALFGTLCNWFILLPRFGRRKIYLIGTATMTTFLFIIGFLQIGANAHGGKPGPLLHAQGAFTMLWTFCFQLSVGQLGWALPAEVGSTRLRQKTVVLARNAYYLASVIARTLEPYFLNPLKWNIKGFTGFVWGSTGLLTFIWAYFRLPETKDRTFDEIDFLFAKGIKARHFAKTNVNTFDEGEPVVVAAKRI
ncbi:hypothetical protein BP6252_03283 [Coleophoma cylindrospora]|uniref:Major facilitator superfamily (MFS) profile domain-containing protein n=1 Tax=Coleophoma cylindrospora TaxID=1849047 RepID=A0A3D8S7U3_9HELO|nr:hypothetical protein BP6252_03283 [Coleophoma cylindrospora]